MHITLIHVVMSDALDGQDLEVAAEKVVNASGMQGVDRERLLSFGVLSGFVSPEQFHRLIRHKPQGVEYVQEDQLRSITL